MSALSASASETAPLAVAVFALALVIVSAYAIRVALVGRVVSARLDGERGTALLGRFAIEAFHWVARGVGRRMAGAGVSADALSYLSLALTFFSIPLCATGRWEAAGLVIAAGASFDALDGIVARERAAASRAGEMLDSFLDRYADAAPFLGLALYAHATRPLVLAAFVAMVGSQMVSYARAKAEALGLHDLPAGIMRRPERVAYLCAALLFGPTLSRWLVPTWPIETVTWAVVALLGVLSNVAALRLFWRARTTLRQAAGTRSSNF
jgi:CDP-diacylglycerol--glycerol-3-phosphate 3-phosphatidyltransferase